MLEVGVRVAAGAVGAVGAGVGAAVSGDNEPSSVILISGKPFSSVTGVAGVAGTLADTAGSAAAGGTKLAICSLINAFS